MINSAKKNVDDIWQNWSMHRKKTGKSNSIVLAIEIQKGLNSWWWTLSVPNFIAKIMKKSRQNRIVIQIIRLQFDRKMLIRKFCTLCNESSKYMIWQEKNHSEISPPKKPNVIWQEKRARTLMLYELTKNLLDELLGSAWKKELSKWRRFDKKQFVSEWFISISLSASKKLVKLKEINGSK